MRQAQLHTARLEAQLHTQAAHSIEAGASQQSIETGASQQAKQAPPQVAAAESGAVEQGRAGLIVAYHPQSPQVCNLMGLLLCLLQVSELV